MKKFNLSSLSSLSPLSSLLFVSLLLLPLLVSCGKNKGGASSLPKDFNTIGDCGRVQYMISHTTPDSVARFIIYSALGRNENVRIDTLAIATNYAYEHLQGPDLDTFSSQYDSLIESLPLADKMSIYVKAGVEDPQKLGYRLGLEYMTSIRDGNKTVADVEKELKEFKRVCSHDPEMYRRFIVGFHTVLELDHGKDVPNDIYQKFRNYE